MREAIEETITVFNAGGDEAVDKDRGGMGGEGGAETINVI